MTKRERQRVFDTWLQTHKGVLFKVVRAYAFTPADRDDLFQEIAVEVWDSIPRYKGDAAVTTWLYRIALYTAISWTRKEKRHRTGREPLAEAERTLEATTQPRDPRLDWIYEQIARLDPVDRSLMLLMLDGFSYREMAQMLGISESNVGVKLNRIKKRLATRQREDMDYGL